MEAEVITKEEKVPAPVAPEKEAKPGIPRKLIFDIVVTVLLSLGALLMLIPFIWMLFAVVKPTDARFYDSFFPSSVTFKGFSLMWENCDDFMEGGIIRGFFNSVLTTVPVVVIQIIVSAFAAYAFAKLKFVGKNIIFLILLSTMMIPFAVIMLPQAWLYGRMNLTQGPLAVIIPKLFGSIGTVFFLRAFFYGIPDSITEAARLDGAGYTRTFVSVLLPLVMPALATQGILSFIGNWNDFLGPLLFIEEEDWYTLPLLVNGLGQSTVDLTQSALVASLISLVPIVVVFAIFQKKIIGSIVFSAVKG